MIKKYILILCILVLLLTSTSCIVDSDTFAEAVAEAIGECLVSELTTDIKMLFIPSVIFQEMNGRWPESREELVEFSREMELDIPDLYWASYEDIHFETQDDDSLRIVFTRVITKEDGTQQRYSREYTISNSKIETDAN